MKDRLPYMPFFVSDYMGSTDVRLMSLAERGAYTHLLFMNWQEGRLEKDPKKLAQLLDCSLEDFEQVWEGIKDKFEVDSKGRIYNKRVEELRKEYLERKKKLSKSGRKGGKSTQAKRKPGFSQASREASQASRVASSQASREAQAKESEILEPPSIQQVTEKTVTLVNGEATVNSPLFNGETVQKSSPSHSPSSPPSQTLPSSSPPLTPPSHTPSEKALSARAREAPDPAKACGPIFNHWNSHDALTRHKSLTPKMRSSIRARLKAGHSEGDLCRAISRYAELCQQEQAPGHNQWGLHQLISRDQGVWIDRMLDPKYRGIQNSRPPPGHTQRSQQNVENVQDWVTRREQHERE